MSKNLLINLYISGHALLFAVFFWHCLINSVMFGRNVWCMFIATPLGSGLTIAMLFWIPRLLSEPPAVEALTSPHIIKEAELWQYVCLYVLFEAYIALGIGLVFALLRFVFRLRGFDRNFWYPLGMMSGIYPLALFMCLIVYLGFFPLYGRH